MTAKDLEELIERVRHWPKDRQEDAAEVLLEMERQDTSGYRLTGAQAREACPASRVFARVGGTLATDEQYGGTLGVMWPGRLRFTEEARDHIAAIYSSRYTKDRNSAAATQ